ncbi:hypothetical protein SCOCK_50042 [Actinacidiphila cocklensis]|uniref:Uncharacterized protein n=1 Tax=Actinacidiphila cocklensis TaxID=887465 RepID=A0A9W4DVL4_9ACTN|nr:hypothetical protein SCOCK_50042 [Actinacidiphila cocklensis]
MARGPGRVRGDHRRQRGRPADHLGRVLQPHRGVGRGRPVVEGRRLVLPVLRRGAAAPGRRLVLRRVRLPPPHPDLGAVRRPRRRPVRRGLADPAPAAGPGQQVQRGRLRRGRRRLRHRPQGRPGADVQGAGGRRALRRGVLHAARPAAAAGQEPGRLAGDLLADRRPAHPGDPVGERARRRRHRHLVAVGRGLHPAGRAPDPGDRRPQARPGGTPGGRGPAVQGLRRPRRGGTGGAARPDRGHRQLHRLPGPAPPRRQLTRGGTHRPPPRSPAQPLPPDKEKHE